MSSALDTTQTTYSKSRYGFTEANKNADLFRFSIRQKLWLPLIHDQLFVAIPPPAHTAAARHSLWYQFNSTLLK